MTKRFFKLRGNRMWPIAMLVIHSACAAPKDGESLKFDVCGRSVQLELALSEEAQQRGFMYRAKEPQGDEGMIFIFKESALRSFWMANVKFPLDILYFDDQGVLVKTHTMYPEPGISPEQLARYSSDKPATFAVELRRGWLAAYKTADCKLELPWKIRRYLKNKSQ